jgi:hypothetical protein
MDFWLKISSLAMPIILLLNLVVSSGIAWLVFAFTRRQSSMDALRLINSRWFELNRMFMDKPHLTRLLRDDRQLGKTDEDVIVFNLLYQVINICHEAHIAAKRRLIDRALSEQVIQGSVAVLRGRREEVLAILASADEYDADFRRRLRRRISGATKGA